jgi:hypothetical protein
MPPLAVARGSDPWANENKTLIVERLVQWHARRA